MTRTFLFRLIFIIVGIMLAYQLWIIAHIWWWKDHNPSESAFMAARLAVMQESNPHATLQHRWVPYKAISIQLKRAVIASEDSTFLYHNGFDWDGIQTAWEKNIKKGKIVAGGSTISQQLAKNLFLSGRRTPWRKIEEAFITVLLENMLSKQRILEIYLNIIEWGDGVFGAEAAAQHYYQVSAKSLNSGQAARLAAMIPNPRFYDKNRHARSINIKASIIVKRMPMVSVPR
jgi:monofunctional biosynthetic peptidoglycan transglycosylase